ncbi:arf-GAP domain and FG repeat-containing protein 1 isoform X1 [Anopheles funestus]|uniref:arf-GAP domain and FG repeat-containing protein 1 isoform X1 n=1 Tax=Anopheles funestus TaxID=62324 RepID=UPI0020C62AF8|nr:arf-GAP domain and FG repeat-containing protein 1 isoform X1 [Anopheles funestus]XP_049288805.1 arf-GAP domain and FG repeat-containing protein 1 isoform X1 [Anopheles funestus]XP_049288806.1 arf-GAP domain and FG repeat-containing protein 1 isoform X1 [Anopheles funestus]
MALVRKKLDDKILKTLRELVGVGGNKECFDCGQKGPTYINMTIGSFVCTSCSGILRGITPPHRVKSISMATFTQEEIEFLKQNGNDNCSRTWLGLWDPKRAIKQEHRDFMIDKYERKRYYLEPASPLKSLPTNASSSLTSLSGGSSKNANESLVPLKTPTLTPPATLRLNRTNSGSCNGLNNVNTSSSSLPGAMGVGAQFQQQFTPDDSGFFGSEPPKILPPTPQKNHMLQRKNGIKIKQPSNGLPPTYGRNQKNGLLNSSTAGGLSGSSGDINANKFTPDADFVADFGSATIVNNVSNGGSHYGSTSSLKNGHSNSDNGVGLYAQHNGNYEKTSTREMENFADFDHNPIFNSAENMKSYFSSNSIDSSTTTSVSSTASVQSLSGPDPFANFYSNTVAGNTNCGSNSTGSTAGTPTASSGSASTGPSVRGVGYTCISPEDNTHAKVHTNYGFGNTFTTGESCYATNECIINGGSGAGSGYANQNYTLPWGNSNGTQPDFNLTRYAGSTNQLNNNVSNDSTQHDTVQWNFWQQFGNNCCWSADDRVQQQQQRFRNSSAQQMMSPQHHHAAVNQVKSYSDQNRWSLPMPVGSNISASKQSNGKSSSTSVHSTPSVDRYAALKDLDDQFREIKLEQQAEANNNTITSNGLGNAASINDSITPTSSANPFKTANPFQSQQQHQHAQQQTMAWPINGINGTSPDVRHQAASAVATNGNGFYATSPYQGGFAHGASSQLYNGNVVNGTTIAGMSYLPPAGYHPNGNGYSGMSGVNGVMMGGQFNATTNGGVSMLNNVSGVTNPVHHFGNFGNPFMAAGTTAGNSNNPFL